MKINADKKRMFLNIGSLVFRITVFLLFVSPLLWLIVSSFKPEQDIFKDMNSLLAFIVHDPTLENYRLAFSRAHLVKSVINSLLYVGLITLFGMIVNSICGYALAKLNVPFAKQILSILILLIIIPFETIVLPLVLIVNYFHWVNHLQVLVVPFIANCFNIYLFRQFFVGIPDAFLEAARVEGASDFTTFIRIVLPLSKTVYATVFILTFVAHWGDFMWPLIVASDESLRTIQIAVQFLFTSPPIRYGIILAGLTFSTIPLAIIFLFFQKYYVQSVTSSGVKG